MRITNCYVITGAPCSGKTSVISEFERLGYRVVHEVARSYIDEKLKKGKSLEEIKADELYFERHILHQKVDIESFLPENEIIFLDRAVPDSIAYFKLAGLDYKEPLNKSNLLRYKKIFILQRLVFEKDRVRSEDDAQAAALERLLEESYQNLGYKPMRIPLRPVRERVDFILQNLQ